ncbi:NAD(P)/FAD-dependent oxidoreductase [Roseomonas sp. CECT 9278]|uniref:flavin-containing monooxygenase n=1 Tax=Roseomonas sp. CECT 9278 TaxID=2845823 RepID=UPI001E600987|nr:NAD(P)/FAD-dependent oxidoreductase [Roseomonas sp. CECT 9278]CAH0149315.1 Phenylacetone monooxygenase [Roseomonas sp. CECT 9278]
MPEAPAAPVMPETTFDALIVGAGFAGLYQLHALRDRLGLRAHVLEAADGVGGTWTWNRYPGARCDSESHAYAFYFSDDLLQSWDWSERYPQQPEILRYLNHVADRLDLKRDITFGARVGSARWDAAAGLWRVATQDGRRYAAPFLVTAVGCLSSTNMPDIPGREDFAGAVHHTGEWPHDGVDVSGKRVAMIGTGSTGIQAAPVLAEAAAHLTVFQRTANYSIPARNRPLDDAFKHWAKAHAAEIRATMHATPNGHPWTVGPRSALEVSAEEREAAYAAAWEKGGLALRATFRDILTDRAANDTAADFIKARIREVVQDPATAAKLADIDHPFATKRPPIDTGYFETFNRANVALADIRADPIERITATGIRLRSGAEHAVDVIVFATGFDAMTGALLRMGISGRDGLALSDAWAAGPRTQLGLQVPGFPNLFTITGPGSPSVLTNMPVAIEQHVEWITDCIAQLRAQGRATIEATDDAAEAWVAHVNDAANATLMPQAGHSWYLGANVPGKPRVFMPYAGGMARYRAICAEVAAQGYPGFVMAGQAARVPA